MMICLIIKHCHLERHMNLLGIHEDPACRGGLQEEETPGHVQGGPFILSHLLSHQLCMMGKKFHTKIVVGFEIWNFVILKFIWGGPKTRNITNLTSEGEFNHP